MISSRSSDRPRRHRSSPEGAFDLKLAKNGPLISFFKKKINN
jgi:hypothetical protein